jgi:flagellin-like hook-associated protein FlgL
MGLRVNQNIAAMNAYRNLSVTDGQMNKSLEKLSSGFRINRAADDAAGLSISEGLRSQIGGLKVAVRNAQDGISVVQTAEGALTETTSILQRMRDLSVQAANGGGLSDDAKANIQSEVSQLKDELTRIADTTSFNGTKLLDGSYEGKFQVGANVGENIAVKVGTDMSAAGLKVDGVDVTNASTGLSADAPADAAADGSAGASVTVASSVDFLAESASYDDLNGTVSYGGKSLDLSTIDFESGATAAEKLVAVQAAVTEKLGDVTVSAPDGAGLVFTGAAAADADGDGTSTAEEISAAAVTFTQSTGAEGAITAIDAAIKTVSTVRSDLGALQNRFDHTINNLNVAVENLSASESRIRDTDMAQEMVGFTRNQILTQAGTAMLAQANQASQGVLSLLR